MTYFTKTAYWRPLVTNSESMDNTINPYFKNPCNPYFASNEARFFLVKTNHMLQYPYVSINLQNVNKFVSKMLKHTRSGKPDVEEGSHI